MLVLGGDVRGDGLMGGLLGCLDRAPIEAAVFHEWVAAMQL